MLQNHRTDNGGGFQLVSLILATANSTAWYQLALKSSRICASREVKKLTPLFVTKAKPSTVVGLYLATEVPRASGDPISRLHSSIRACGWRTRSNQAAPKRMGVQSNRGYLLGKHRVSPHILYCSRLAGDETLKLHGAEDASDPRRSERS